MPDLPRFTPDVPGRGYWNIKGGLLPLRSQPDSRSGYYRPPWPDSGERMVGSAWPSGRDKAHSARVVHLAVKGLQRLLGLPEPSCDGFLGDVTGAAIVKMQRRYGLEVDAVCGPLTAKALLTPLITATGEYRKVPVDVLGGIMRHESALDFACVGTNGVDTGLAQINLGAHDLALDRVLDPTFAVDWTAVGLRKVYDRWNGKVAKGVDPWDIAVANHNSPLLAQRWAKEGKPPVIPGRIFQIEEYVRKARSAWNSED